MSTRKFLILDSISHDTCIKKLEINIFKKYTVRKFVLNLTFHSTFHVSQTVYSNYYVTLTQDEYVRK